MSETSTLPDELSPSHTRSPDQVADIVSGKIRFGLDLDRETEKSDRSNSQRDSQPRSYDSSTTALDAMSVARSIRDLLNSAFSSPAEVESANQFFSACDKVRELWNFAAQRNQAYKDLLGLIEVATVGRNLEDITLAQQTVVKIAVADLLKVFLTTDQVSQHRRGFIKAKIDLLRPFNAPKTGRRFSVSVEEISD